MNKSEIVAAVAAKLGGDTTRKQAAEYVDAVLGVVEDALVAGEKVQFVGFGTFEVKEHAEREGHNPRTGEVIKVAASKAPVFKAGKSLKDKVNH